MSGIICADGPGEIFTFPNPDLEISSDSEETESSSLRSLGNTPWWLLGVSGVLVASGVYFSRKRFWKNGDNVSEITEQKNDLEPLPNELEQQNLSDKQKTPLGSRLNPSNPCKTNTDHSFLRPPSFRELICSQEDQEKIEEVVKTLDETAWYNLIWKRSRLLQIEQEIDHVHSLAFLWTIFKNNDLKTRMQRIFQFASNTLQKNGFMDGVNKGMSRYSSEKLDPYLDEWAEALKTTKEAVKPLVDAPFSTQKNWEALVRHLMFV